MRGQSLLPEISGGRTSPPRDIVIDMPYTDQTPRRRALIHGSFKLIVSENEPTHLLFDLGTDPGERHDLAAQRPEIVAELKARLRDASAKLPDYPAERRVGRQY